MKIKFKTDTELVVVTEYDEANDNIVSDGPELFKAGEICEVDLIDTEFNHCDIQFGDGSVAHGVFKECFEIL